MLISFTGFVCFEGNVESPISFLGSIQSGHVNAALPAFLYTFSTTSQSLGAYHLDIMPYLMLSQVKLIFTPVFSQGLFKRSLQLHQWLFLMAMAGGMISVQMDSRSSHYSLRIREDDRDKNAFFGVAAMLVAGCCSAFASVYMEAILKAPEHGFIARNAQLAVYSLLCAIGGFLWQSGFDVASFFRGYTVLVWGSIILQATGGFLVSWVVCTSNSMSKNYAQSLGFLAALVIPLVSSPQLMTPHVGASDWEETRHDILTSLQLCYGAILVLLGVFGALWKTEMRAKGLT